MSYTVLMPISTVMIDQSQWQIIYDTGESHFFDIKSRDIAPGKLTKTLSAFANADGGELYIGVEEDKVKKTRTWRGFDSDEDANGHLQIFETLFPLGNDFQYEFVSMPGMAGKLLHVNVLKTQDIKYASDGVIYIRRGAQGLPVNNPDKIKLLEYDKGISSFENEKVSDAEIELVTDSEAAKLLTTHVVPKADPADWLRKQRLIVDDKPNIAALVLLCDEPQAVIPNPV